MFGGHDPKKDPKNYKDCWLCNGTGKRNDALGKEARKKDPKYTCNGCQGTGKELKYDLPDIGNIVPVSTLIKHPKRHPFAIVTPDGEWHQEAEVGWWGMTSNPNVKWEKEKKELLKQYADYLIVAVDCHI